MRSPRLPLALANPSGPPGHEHVAHLAPPAEGDEVTAREIEPISEGFLARARAVAEALFADERGPADPSRIAWVVKDFGDFAARGGGGGGARARSVFTLCLFVLTYVAPLFVFRLGALRSLPLHLRSRALERLEASALGPAALGPKAILCLLWFEHEDTQRETGTTPTCLRSEASEAAR